VARRAVVEISRRLLAIAPTLFDELRGIYNIDPRDFTD